MRLGGAELDWLAIPPSRQQACGEVTHACDYRRHVGGQHRAYVRGFGANGSHARKMARLVPGAKRKTSRRHGYTLPIRRCAAALRPYES